MGSPCARATLVVLATDEQAVKSVLTAGYEADYQECDKTGAIVSFYWDARLRGELESEGALRDMRIPYDFIVENDMEIEAQETYFRHIDGQAFYRFYFTADSGKIEIDDLKLVLDDHAKLTEMIRLKDEHFTVPPIECQMRYSAIPSHYQPVKA